MSGSPQAFITDLYSDIDLADPLSYYGGFKTAAVTRWGLAEHLLSDIWTGELKASTMGISVSDTARLIRPQLVSSLDKYWTGGLTVRMIDRDGRAQLLKPKTVFQGTLVDAQPNRPLGWDLTLGDAIAQGLLSDEFQVPFRMVRDGFLSLLDEINENLDQDAAEPIIYGIHLRTVSTPGSPGDPASAQGFACVPMLLGKITVGGNQYWCWLVCAHATANINDVLVNNSSILADEGTKWQVPHYGGWSALFGGNPYVDFPSDTYGDLLRYTLILGKVGQTDPDGVADGTKTLTIQLEGVEPVGDGSGAVIVDRFQQYKHFAINYLANQGFQSYRTGAWKTNPLWTTIDGSVEIVDEDSFDAATAIGQARLPSIGSPDVGGYIGAAIIGANGERDSVRRWLADWNRSCACRFGWTWKGRMRIVLLNPTVTIKATAPLYTDGYEIIRGSFETGIRWQEQANAVPFKADFRYDTGQWVTFGTVRQEQSILNYGKTITAQAREYPFAPGITQATHLALLESIIRQDPPRVVTLASNVDNDKLGALELGDYINFRHYAAVGEPSQVRLGQVQRLAVDVGKRIVYADVLDCGDLIGYADPPLDLSPDPNNAVCADAVDLDAETFPYLIAIDTTGRATDGSATGFCGSGIAYNPAWWKFHPTTAMRGGASTSGSEYDTVLSVWRVPTGNACAGKVLYLCDDDEIPLFNTSYVDLPFLDPFYDYYLLATGKNPTDAGRLQFTFYAEEL